VILRIRILKEKQMSKVSVEEAARNLKALLEQVAAGEEVILVEQDKPVARLVPPSTQGYTQSGEG
jgi:prevent-host-death family protein